jgi:hypothetical protein
MVKANKNLSTEILTKVITNLVNQMVSENIPGIKVEVIKANLNQVFVVGGVD